MCKVLGAIFRVNSEVKVLLNCIMYLKVIDNKFPHEFVHRMAVLLFQRFRKTLKTMPVIRTDTVVTEPVLRVQNIDHIVQLAPAHLRL